MTKLERAAKVAVNNCMFIKEGETVLIIVDEPKRKIGEVLFTASKKAGAEVLMVEIIPRDADGEEPPKPVSDLMKKVDVVMAPTSRSLSHTNARRAATRAGVRIATLPGITEETMTRALNADYEKVAKRSNTLAKLLSRGSTARITTPSGTDITMSIKGREGKPDTGLVYKGEDFSNLPAGEAYIAPMEKTAEGVYMVDGSMAGLGLLKKPLTITVEKGHAVDIKGGAPATKLKKMLDAVGPKARNIAELGIGTNDKARLCGSVLEDEKVMGTVHLAIGDNKSMGGRVSVPIHLDGMLLKPTLYIDDKMIMKNGKMMIDLGDKK